VDIDQGTGNLSHNFTDNNRLNLYYALQHDLRGEPPTTQGNNLPGFGDHREARRQIGTINDTQVFSPTLVNELRMGYNRIHIVFKANDTENASAFGINSGVNTPIGLPQITIAGGGSAGPAFGGLGGFPQGRGDYSAALSDTLSWVHGKHTIKVGGEYRRIDVNSFAYTPGTFGFSSIPNFINDVASSFSVTAANGSTRVFVNSIGAFATDSYKVTPRLLLDLGIRWDWYGSPSEGAGRFVAFIPSTVSLVQLGTNGTSSEPYNQNFRWQPRVGFAYDLFGNGKTIIRSPGSLPRWAPIPRSLSRFPAPPPV
jgi:outer membrane receptor protein involved in Fe transport